MVYPSRRFSLARNAIDLVLRRLSAEAASRQVEDLRLKAQAFLCEVNAWNISPPSDEQREELMKRVLKLHVEVANLARCSSRDREPAREIGRVRLRRVSAPCPQAAVSEATDDHEADPESGVKTKIDE